MTREEFKKLEEICKRAWRGLAVSGNGEKPKYLGKYEEDCPACELSKRASEASGKFVGGFNCRYCPVTAWRRKADGGERGVCIYTGELFNDWAYGPAGGKRKAAALKISKLNWSWLKIYEKVEKP